MNSYIVKLSFSHEKWKQHVASREDNSSDSSPSRSTRSRQSSLINGTTLTPTKIVKLHYNTSKAPERHIGLDGEYTPTISPSRSTQRQRNRTPTPPTLIGEGDTTLAASDDDVFKNNNIPKEIKKEDSQINNNQSTLPDSEQNNGGVGNNNGAGDHEDDAGTSKTQHEKHTQITNKPLSKNNDNLVVKNPKNTSIKPYQESLNSMDKYQDIFLHSSLSNIELESNWYYDLQNVSQRLHYLREVYKSIQTLKKKKPLTNHSNPNSNSIQKHNINLQSSTNVTPMALDDDNKRYDVRNNDGDHYEDESSGSGSGSNTDNNRRSRTDDTTDSPLGKRVSKRRVQFQF